MDGHQRVLVGLFSGLVTRVFARVSYGVHGDRQDQKKLGVVHRLPNAPGQDGAEGCPSAATRANEFGIKRVACSLHDPLPRKA